MSHEHTSANGTLDRARIGEALTVIRVSAPDNAPEWTRWLEEIGFLPGEQVRLMAKAIPGGDPMVVRVGQSTFALRRAEAACIEVIPTESSAPVPESHFVLEGSKA